MNTRQILLLFLVWSVASCLQSANSPAPDYDTLTVFAAASLTEAFTEIGEAFMSRNPGAEIVFNFAGSQQLAQQLAQGAPADVFASANQAQMEAAIAAGRVSNDNPRPFALNKLVVIVPSENPANLTKLSDLGKPGIKLVLAAKEVPAGSYSIQFLEKTSLADGFSDNFMAKVITNVVSYEENVRFVYSKVALGEADAGIIYITDIPKGNPDGVEMLEIPTEFNVQAEYPIASISDSLNLSLAEAFQAFILSPEGQEILTGYGFTSVQ